MQVVLEFIAALVTALAVAVFSQFGVDLRPAGEAAGQPEVRRTVEREPVPVESAFVGRAQDDC